MEFTPFPKVPRLSREVIITEKIDGTNASVHIQEVPSLATEENAQRQIVPGLNRVLYEESIFFVQAASRKRFITPDDDNFGFAAWVRDNAEELVKLGAGSHFGEWWGRGVQRGYELDEKRFSLFNTGRWADQHVGGNDMSDGREYTPECCRVVPILWRGMFDELGTPAYSNGGSCVIPNKLQRMMTDLYVKGSTAAPGYRNPEGIMIYHTAANQMFKKTFEGDEGGKG